MNKSQPVSTGIKMRSYSPGDETQIVDLLNLCYGKWGTVQQWEWRYARYPAFDSDNVFILEKGNDIVGHRAFTLRGLVIQQGHEATVAVLSDTAIHPDYRGFGLYTKLHEVTLQEASLRGACLIFTTNLKGSITYRHDKKTGFVEVWQAPTYIKVINPGRVLKSGLSDFIHKNHKIKNVLKALGCNLYFSIGETRFSIEELVGETSQQPKEGEIRVIFDKSSVLLLTKFRTSSTLQRIRSLALLVLYRKMKIRFSSFGAFLKFVRKGAAILDSL